jgi:hypothetical protein
LRHFFLQLEQVWVCGLWFGVYGLWFVSQSSLKHAKKT